MRINFKDKSFLEFERHNKNGNVHISIGAKSSKNILETIVNSVEITQEELQSLVACLTQENNNNKETGE